MGTEKKVNAAPHSLTVSERNGGKVSGVTKVLSSNAECLVLVTSCGQMTVNGSELRIDKFCVDDGELAFCGKVDVIKYQTAKAPLLKRIFK